MSYFKYKNFNIYYKVYGEGKPLVIIHGDTASSKMFIPELKFYSKNFKVILLDLIGQGKSQRVNEMPLNHWQLNSMLVIELCKYIGISNVNLLGTSGGAIIALNAVLEEPTLFNKIILDSFMGENLSHDFAKKIYQDRKIAKSKLSSKLFWFMMHGFDWENVIDQNTNLIIDFSRNIGNFFECDLSSIENNVLITGSLEDDFIPNIGSILKSINSKIENSKLVIFNSGNHPAMFSNKKEFRDLVLNFLT
ncbi:alpha/beta fold hydrolase [Clostridium sporogenes]|uniref:alpha/beta fold hydrolase n=1 Tax=Clostridium sporogenes TaxID=1509 RepID=UPI00024BAEE3|nr:alpha/beta hydrolase [Clostridium sporogenes]EHN14638.1 prolyl aminopeptidase [Clostridium sporogenes PA 3679]MCW6106270.1 alpha/beta hydrolase [Clostridium sporogenes]NFQ34929.1 alpha/beta hydrolase [Clostridium sporogenes]NFQ61136.1 alpha/beta hydrolase [Clostridium sporogenes]NFU11510.1 alpha/beta hydrolase [Clostridium sporogenes]